MKSVKKRMLIDFGKKGTANLPLNVRDIFKMINMMADAIEELQQEVMKLKDKDKL